MLNSVKQSDLLVDTQDTNSKNTSVDNLAQKMNKINVSDSSGIQTNFRKTSINNNNNNNRNLYHMAYSAYPYSMINSNNQQMPINYMYSTGSFANNVYSRTNYNNYFMNANQKRVHNLQKLWPHSLKKSAQKVNSPELEQKSNHEDISVKESPVIEKPLVNHSNENLIDSTKTPMCLINELARFNKIKHEYVLLDEIGPAHKKIFYIMLKLGIETDNEESYTAQGSSIKKTQHAAAELAIKQTKFKIPIKRAIKTSSNNEESSPSSLSSSTPNENQTDASKAKENNENNLQANIKIKNNSKINPPTVRLNTLAMKLGLVANYSHTVISYPNSINYNLDLSQQKQQNLFDYNTYTSFMNNDYNQQMHTTHQSYQIAQQIQRPKQFIKVKLTFAEKEFNGQGITLQIAKHDAASKALDYFSDPDKFLEAKSLSNSSQNTTVKAYRPPGFYKQQESIKTETETEKINNEEETKPKNILNSEIKSEIQLVYEYAYYLKKSVDFELVQESGPSHIKKFVTKCIIGNRDTDKTSELLISSNESNSFPLKTIGEGNSKKQSKKESAIKMLVILKEKFEPLLLISSNNRLVQLNETKTESESNKTIVSSELTNKKHRKNKAKNIIKNKKTSPEYGKGSINPISRLMQIQQAKKEREPLFELLPQSKRRQQEFTIQVTIELTTTTTTTATSTGVAAPSNNILKCEGKGSTKKIAKQKAAEAMLIKLGYLSRQPTQSVLKPSLKLTPQNSSEEISDVQDELNNKPSDDLTSKAQAINEPENQVETKSNEKKVKFLEDPNLIKSENNTAGKLKPIQMNPENKEKLNKKAQNQAQTNHLIKQQKIKQIQEMIATNQSKLNNIGDPNKHLDLIYKIAFELLESVEKKKNNSSDLSLREFCSETAEQLLSKNKLKQEENENKQSETNQKTQEELIQFKILNGGLDSVNYKQILEYLAETIGFKVIYQSLLGRDGSVYSYVNLSVLTATEKPLNGTGATHIESSNAAALCALQYLSSKYNNKTKSSNSKAEPKK